jgi:hypothetical protein
MRQITSEGLNLPACRHDVNRRGIVAGQRPRKGNQFIRDGQDPAVGQFGNDKDFIIHKSYPIPLNDGYVKSSAGKARKP